MTTATKTKKKYKRKTSDEQRKSPYEVITDRILEIIDGGTLPWAKGWATYGMPTSLQTGKAYRGCNAFLLGCAPYGSPYWVTFKQAQERKGTIKKGEKGWPVIFWKFNKYEDAETGKEKTIPFLRRYTVFNVEQTEGVEKVPEIESITRTKVEVIESAEGIVKGFITKPQIEDRPGGRAIYSPGLDVVGMPLQTDFDDDNSYYSTLFHELTHSTGHKDRLKRDMGNGFGSNPYAKEELIAEMGSAFLCGEAGIFNHTEQQTASYVEGWARALRRNPEWMIKAAGAAQKAADYILRRTFDN